MKFERVKIVLAVAVLMLMLCSALLATAQTVNQAAAMPTPVPASDTAILKPVILDAAERADADKTLKTIGDQARDAEQIVKQAQAQMASAQETLKRLKADFDLYVAQLALKKRVDPDKYEVTLSALDDKGEVLGFKPKAPPAPSNKPAEKK